MAGVKGRAEEGDLIDATGIICAAARGGMAEIDRTSSGVGIFAGGERVGVRRAGVDRHTDFRPRIDPSDDLVPDTGREAPAELRDLIPSARRGRGNPERNPIGLQGGLILARLLEEDLGSRYGAGIEPHHDGESAGVPGVEDRGAGPAEVAAPG